MNVQSILPKIDELEVVAALKKPDVICLTETWLNSSIDSSVINVTDYRLCRTDREDRKGGGTAIYVRRDINYFDKTTSYRVSNEVEYTLIEIPCFRVLLICIYIPPNLDSARHQSILSKLITITDESMNSKTDFNQIIVGDFNDFNVGNLAEELALHDLVLKPTRKNNILDHILVSKDLLLHCSPDRISYDSPLGNSDHLMLSLLPSTTSKHSNFKTLHTLFDLRQSHLFDLKNMANLIDWEGLLTNVDDVNTQLNIVQECISLLVNENIPKRAVVITNSDKAWMTPLTKALINDRWTAFRLGQWKLFNHLKQKVKLEIIRAKQVWAGKLKSSPHGLWKLVKRNARGGIRDNFANLISGSHSVGELLEDIARNVSSEFDATDSNKWSATDDNWELVLNEHEVCLLLQQMKPNKSPGMDGIPSIIYRELANQLSKPLTKLMNTSLAKREFPNRWKQAVIVPIPKSNPPDVHKLRYIALLPALSKIMEKLVLRKTKHLFCESFGDEQHGFRPGYSTATGLLQLMDDATAIFDDLSYSGLAILCFDMSRAFDCIDHSLVGDILTQNDFPTGFTTWLQSYLRDRSAVIKIGGNFSSEVKIRRGVPQGSVLGPPVFCSFIKAIKSNTLEVKTMKYADDVTLIVPIKDADSGTITNKIEREISNIENQTKSLHLNLNLSKSKALIYTRTNLPSACTLSIPTCESAKILGVVMNKNLTWDDHVKYICKKANQRLHILRRLKKLVTKEELHNIYLALIRSLFEYSSQVFVGLNKTLDIKMHKINNRAHRIIFNTNNPSDISCDCSINTINIRRLTQSKSLFKTIANSPNHLLHSRIPHILHFSGHFSVPFCRTEKRQKSFFPFSTTQLNSDNR